MTVSLLYSVSVCSYCKYRITQHPGVTSFVRSCSITRISILHSLEGATADTHSTYIRFLFQDGRTGHEKERGRVGAAGAAHPWKLGYSIRYCLYYGCAYCIAAPYIQTVHGIVLECGKVSPPAPHRAAACQKSIVAYSRYTTDCGRSLAFPVVPRFLLYPVPISISLTSQLSDKVLLGSHVSARCR